MTLPTRARRVLRSIIRAVPTGVVLGRRSSGDGPAEFIPLDEITNAQLDGITSAHGAVLFRGATAWQALAPGTAGQVLTTQGSGSDPAWSAAAATFLQLTDTPSSYSGQSGSLLRVNATEDGLEYLTASVDWSVTATGTGASQNITLPESGLLPGEVLVVVNGLVYETDEYSISGDTLTLTTNSNGDSIEIRPLSGVRVGGGGGGGGLWWFQPPAAADFPTFAQGAVGALTLTDDADAGLIVQGASPVVGDEAAIAVKALPSGGAASWQVDARIEAATWPANFAGVGIAAYRSANQTHVSIGPQWVNGHVLAIQRRTLTAFGATLRSGAWGNGAPVFVRLAYDQPSDTYTYSVSTDGKRFFTYASFTGSAQFSGVADYVGVMVFYNRSSGPPAHFVVPYWSQSF